MRIFQVKSETALDRLKHVYDNDRARVRFSGGNGARLMAGLESFKEESFQDFKGFRANLGKELRHILSSNEEYTAVDENGETIDEEEVITNEGLDAAAIIAAAAENPVEYHENAGVVKEISGSGVVPSSTIGVAGSIAQTTDSVEAFDKSSLANFVPASILFNAKASKQAPMAEMFYKTIVVTAQNAGLEVTINRPVVQHDVRRGLNYNEREFNQRNLIDAIIEHKILDSNSVKLVPVYLDSGEDDTTAHFVDASIAPAVPVQVDDETVLTAPLLIGREVDIVALSQPPSLRRAGTPDFSDALDPGLGLRTLTIKAESGSDVSIFDLNLLDLPFSKFQKAPEGESRDMILNFRNNTIPLSHLTTQRDGTDAPNLALLSDPSNHDVIVRLDVQVSGRANLQFSTIEVTSARVKVEGVYRSGADNYQERMDDAAAQAIIDAIGDLTAEGYEVEGTRSNRNLHTRGLLVDTREHTEKFPVLMGQPLSHLSPLGGNIDENAKVETLITAARIRTNNNAHTKLLNYVETLKVLNPNSNRRYSIPELEGLARFFVRPYFEERDVDLMAAVNSIKSHERAQDVAACIVNEIRRWAYRAIKISGYAAAVEQLGGGRIKVLIGTDREIINHIQITGDTRLIGLNVDYEMQATDDNRFHNRIILGLTRTGGAGEAVVDPLGFGNHVWVPEFIGEAPVDREGRTTRELTVQTRTRHINHVPVVGVLNIINLDQAVTEYKNLITETVGDEEDDDQGNTGP